MLFDRLPVSIISCKSCLKHCHSRAKLGPRRSEVFLLLFLGGCEHTDSLASRLGTKKEEEEKEEEEGKGEEGWKLASFLLDVSFQLAERTHTSSSARNLRRCLPNLSNSGPGARGKIL